MKKYITSISLLFITFLYSNQMIVVGEVFTESW